MAKVNSCCYFIIVYFYMYSGIRSLRRSPPIIIKPMASTVRAAALTNKPMARPTSPPTSALRPCYAECRLFCSSTVSDSIDTDEIENERSTGDLNIPKLVDQVSDSIESDEIENERSTGDLNIPKLVDQVKSCVAQIFIFPRFGSLVLKHGVLMGTGFIVSESGHLFTAAHNVVTAVNIEEEDGIKKKWTVNDIRVVLFNDVEREGCTPVVSKVNVGMDLALLILPEEYLHHLGHVAVFSKKDAEIGDEVFTIGYLDGFPFSLRFGVICDPARLVTECTIERGTFLSTLDVPETFKMVEVDMSAGPGQSGGALFSSNGLVIGVMFIITTHHMHTVGSFAVHLDFIRAFMESSLDRKFSDPIMFEAIHPFFVPSDILTVFEVLAERQESAREGERAKDEEEIDYAEEIDSAEEN